MQEQKETKRGKIATEGLATCVGYAIYMPQKKEAFVGHLNDLGWPNNGLRFEDQDVRDKMMKTGKAGEELCVFIFGGDRHQPESNDLVGEIYSRLSRTFKVCIGKNYKNKDALPRIFCDTSRDSHSDIYYGGLIMGPKVNGLYIDTSTGVVRLQLDREMNAEERLELGDSICKTWSQQSSATG